MRYLNLTWWIVVLALAAPAAAQQDWFDYGDAEMGREADFVVLVLDPDGVDPDNPGEGAYLQISVRDLLRDLVRFPDNHRRYVGVRGAPAGAPPSAFMASDFSVTSSAVGWGTGIDLSAYTGPETAVRIAVAVPVAAGPLRWLNLQGSNDGQNSITSFARQATNVTLGGVECAVWALRGTLQAFLVAHSQVYFDPTATEPAP